jgi:pimeloyl-ACP methyl ester carboxylesterase
VSEVRYARSGDVNIAYNVTGSGPIDIVWVPGWVSHLENDLREIPPLARLIARLARFSRLIKFDKRGTGMSDRVNIHDLPTLEQRMDDVRAVMEAAGSERAALFGISEGGPMSVLFAATYPERTAALLMYGSYARRTRGDGYPWGPTPEEHDAWIASIEATWGTDVDIERRAPTLALTAEGRESYARRMREAASPGAAHALAVMNAHMDVRAILPTIRVPTLILHKTRERLLPIEGGRYLASHIPGAKLVELPGEDHIWVEEDAALIGDAIEEFLTGVRPVPYADRVLATVLYTDIVGSTKRALAVGDAEWRRVLEGHHATVREELVRHRGREIDNAGDGFLAAFDGPARAVSCALAIRDAVRRHGIEVRAGVHTGECEVIGAKLGGVAIHVGARVLSAAGPSEVLVSRTVRDLVAGSGLRFEERGRRQLKDLPEEIELFAAAPPA